MPFNTSDDQDRPRSKTQRKREMQARQELGEKIMALPGSQRDRLPLSDDMRQALEEAERIRSHEARRRHMQYVGKLMRHEDVDAIQTTFDLFEQDKRQRDQRLHHLERWRDRLIDEGDSAVEAFISEFPSVDRQALRQLIRNAQRERDRQKPPTSARKLFKLLRDTAGL
ncbi:ribosome biogenesis factor YjgA [Aidingimonas lacisalsi]|uniref:ribosome biogenesis factor YjgA n=1 Tax=Aidingimonas lacisalsi TaxID=2604086 RepID=UPI0011D220AA|nr:ribosome biogenesis factor YjgA [Aidingimonas lacisalsi]